MKRKNLFFSTVFTTVIVAMTACGGNGGFSAKTVQITTQEDSINYTLGLTNGVQIKQMYLANDSNKNAAADFIKGIDKEFNRSKGKSEVYMNGYGLGQWLKEQQENGILENPNYKIDINLMKQGLINAFRNYQDSTGFTSDLAQGYVQQIFNKIQQAKYMEEMQKQQQLQQLQTQPDTASQTENNQ